ncbi:hypothetical protein V8F20_008288 [Naviculisporaceae sp. PSN 640]
MTGPEDLGTARKASKSGFGSHHTTEYFPQQPLPTPQQPTPAPTPYIKTEHDPNPWHYPWSGHSISAPAPPANSYQANSAPPPVIKTEREPKPTFNTSFPAPSVPTNSYQSRLAPQPIIKSEKYPNPGFNPSFSAPAPRTNSYQPHTALPPIIKTEKEPNLGFNTNFSAPALSLNTYPPQTAPLPIIKTERNPNPGFATSFPAPAPLPNSYQPHTAPPPIMKTERDHNAGVHKTGTGVPSMYTNTPQQNEHEAVRSLWHELGFGKLFDDHMDKLKNIGNPRATDTASVHHRDPNTMARPKSKMEEEPKGTTGFDTTATDARIYALAAAYRARFRPVPPGHRWHHANLDRQRNAGTGTGNGGADGTGTDARGGYLTTSPMDSQANKVTKPGSRTPSRRAASARARKLIGASHGVNPDGEAIRNPDIVKEDNARPRAKDPNASFIDDLRQDEGIINETDGDPVSRARDLMSPFPSWEIIAAWEIVEAEMDRRKRAGLWPCGTKSEYKPADKAYKREDTGKGVKREAVLSPVASSSDYRGTQGGSGIPGTSSRRGTPMGEPAPGKHRSGTGGVKKEEKE